MKKALTILAVLTAVATPVLAQAQQYRTYGSDVPSATQNNEAARYDHAKGNVSND
jgi:hypothetical protein